MVNDAGQYFNGVVCQPFAIHDIHGATFEYTIFGIVNLVKLDPITTGASRSRAVDNEFPPAFCKCVISGCLIIVIGPIKAEPKFVYSCFFVERVCVWHGEAGNWIETGMCQESEDRKGGDVRRQRKFICAYVGRASSDADVTVYSIFRYVRIKTNIDASTLSQRFCGGNPKLTC